MAQLFRYGELNQDSILDEINTLKKKIESDSFKLDNLVKTKEKITALNKAEIQLSEYCQLLKDHLDYTSFQEKRDILNILSIKVTDTTDTINIEGIIPLETTPFEPDIASDEPAHYWMNIGIVVQPCV